MKTDLSVKIGDILLKNPIMGASGAFGLEMSQLIDFNKLGALVPKSITLEPRLGNPPPRLVETPCGMLNAVGIQNEGIYHFVNEVLPKYSKFDSPLIVSISAFSSEEFLKMVEILEPYKEIAAIELNISCPNLEVGGKSFGMDEKGTYGIVKAIRKNTNKTIIAKLTPNVTDISSIAQAAESAGADALSLINTVTGMAIDIKTRRPKLGNITGGLSGPAIKPIAIRMVWEVSQVVNIPIIGIGGIMNVEDVIEFLLAGASAVQIGTGAFVHPTILEDTVLDLEDYLVKNNYPSIKDLIGGVKIETKANVCEVKI